MKIRSLLIAVALCLSSPAALRAENLPPQLFPVYGGSGGTAFTRDCGKGYVLTGLRWRKGAVIDAIGIMCRPVKSDGSLGPETTVGTLAGGGGGSSGAASCPAGRVAGGAMIKSGTYLGEFLLMCFPWKAATRTFIKGNPGDGLSFTADTGTAVFGDAAFQHCEATSQPGRAIRGRAGSFVDAIGLICNEP